MRRSSPLPVFGGSFPGSSGEWGRCWAAGGWRFVGSLLFRALGDVIPVWVGVGGVCVRSGIHEETELMVNVEAVRLVLEEMVQVVDQKDSTAHTA